MQKRNVGAYRLKSIQLGVNSTVPVASVIAILTNETVMCSHDNRRAVAAKIGVGSIVLGADGEQRSVILADDCVYSSSHLPESLCFGY